MTCGIMIGWIMIGWIMMASIALVHFACIISHLSNYFVADAKPIFDYTIANLSCLNSIKIELPFEIT